MKVSELGEFALIERLAAIVGQPPEKVLLGIGDDAAAWEGDGKVILATTDSLVESVHFTPGVAAWREIGWKALAVNLSDIAAMGGSPTYALVSLGLRPDLEVEAVDDLYQGMGEMARRYRVAIVGGDLHRTPSVIITLCLLGEAAPGQLLTRHGACPGDLVAVTGSLGAAAGGLRLLREKPDLDLETTSFLRRAHLQPEPRVAEGQLLARIGVRAAIDVSDGLLSDLGHLALASRSQARVWASRLPVHPLTRAAFPQDCLALALSGGEDYELLFTAPPDIMERVKKEMGGRVTVIGEITAGEAGKTILLDQEGREISWPSKGWDHFTLRSG